MRVVQLGLALVIVLALGFVFGAGFFLSPQDKLELSDAIVVISGGETELRVAEGVKLFNEGWAPTIIMSGAARDEGPSNAAAMKRLAQSSGVPASSILVEEESSTTFENAHNTAEIIEQERFSQIILVTSPYHQRRAHLVFTKALTNHPVTIINHSALDSAWRKNGWWRNEWARSLTFSELGKTLYTWLLPFPKAN